jgi:oligopeptide/dipeptide ABC transporter ATP-binding protein
MYAGQVVEQASVRAVFHEPQHPYTVGLLGSVPRPDESQARLAAIDGQLPNPLQLPRGCRFAARCPFAQQRCREHAPMLSEVGAGHFSACWRAPLDPAQLIEIVRADAEPVA